MDTMTSKKLAMIALIGITMLALIATPAFAEKSVATSNHHGGKKQIGAKAFTTINFRDNCGVSQSGWWQAYTYLAPYDVWNVAWSWPSTIDGCLFHPTQSFYSTTFQISDSTAGWTEQPSIQETYNPNTNGVDYYIYANGVLKTYNAGDSISATDNACYTYQCYNAPTLHWIA